jgi:IS4 transposase
MPDTKENQRLYPQPSGQKEGCGFPVMRFVAVFSLITGLIVASRKSNLHTHEKVLWRRIWGSCKKGDVVLADRAFCAFTDFWFLSKKELDCVMRLHQRRKEQKIIHRFNKNDYLVQWEKGKASQKAEWITLKKWEKIPETMTVRYIKVQVQIPGFRTKELTVATTLLDNKSYPANEIAALYRKRWMAELFLRNIKTTMHMDVLRCKTPEMVHKEFTFFIIAYNLVCSLVCESALKYGLNPYQISFKNTINIIRNWVSVMTGGNGKVRKDFIETLMMMVASQKIPTRNKKRQEPRAIKRRHNSTYQLLTKSRNFFQEIPHRHSYRKRRRVK